MSDTDTDDLPDVSSSERSELLDILDEGIHEAHRKAVSGRVYDTENEKVRQGWFRTLGYLAGQYRQLKKDEQLDELSERVDRIEEQQPRQNYR